jgi:ubiquinol-cytochrome c reductase iron-sulfur subunit
MTASLQTADGPAVPDTPLDPERRNAIVTACVVGGAGCVGVAVPIVASFAPSEREKAAGGPVEVDISSIPAGEMRVVEWRGKPVWVLHRSPAMIASLKAHDAELGDPDSKRNSNYPSPDYALKDLSSRSIKPEFFVAIGICTHLGCSPKGPFAPGENAQLGDQPGFFCPCHGSTFDLAGRVFKDKPAADNLQIPPYNFKSDSVIVIGEDKKSA